MTDIKSQLQTLPDSPGIYKFFDESGKLLYVGKSVSIKKRVSSYFSQKNLGPKTDLLVSQISAVKFIKVFSEFEALLLESELIRTNQPFFNIISKDDKSPIYIKISSDPIALISLTRKQKPQKGVFLKGPFPNNKTAREILKLTRRIFPYCVHKKPTKPCLYVHLGLCPYPYRDEESKQEYVKTTSKIRRLLSGKSQSLIRDLTSEMKNLSQEQKYEEAQVKKKQIESLRYLRNTYRTPREFLEQPTLVDDLTLARLKDFQKALELKKIPKRIECYDISNISGKNATGSMVVMTNGKIDKGEYRRFKIKFKNTPDDFEMMREVLARRIKNDWPKPDVIIIDGGKGQLSAAAAIINKYRFPTTLVSLAKRLEQIHRTNTAMPLSLPKESPARKLAQEIRDEAHRFAITYHRKLRSKSFLK